MDTSVLPYELRGQVPVFALGERVDDDVVRVLGARLKATAKDGHSLVAVDMLGVGILDLDTCTALSTVLRKVCRRLRVALVVSDPRLRWLFEICRIDGLTCHPTLDAVAAFDSEPLT